MKDPPPPPSGTSSPVLYPPVSKIAPEGPPGGWATGGQVQTFLGGTELVFFGCNAEAGAVRPSQEGALGLFHLPTRIAPLTLAQYQRVLHAEGPSQVHSLFIEALRARRPGGTKAARGHQGLQYSDQLCKSSRGCGLSGKGPGLSKPHPTPLPTPPTAEA